jgi:hypothetical protein
MIRVIQAEVAVAFVAVGPLLVVQFSLPCYRRLGWVCAAKVPVLLQAALVVT